MSHARQTIRDAVVAALTAGNTLAGPRVYATVYDARNAFPALCVEDTGEDQQLAQTYHAGRAGRRIDRTLTLAVTAEVQQASNYATTRDTLLAQVETLMANLVITGVKDIQPAGYRPDLSVIADLPVTIGQQRFAILYSTAQASPGVTL
jgi:hypothetical protein